MTVYPTLDERSAAAFWPGAGDYPSTSPEWGTKNLVVSLLDRGDGVVLAHQPLPVMPDELKKYFEES